MPVSVLFLSRMLSKWVYPLVSIRTLCILTAAPRIMSVSLLIGLFAFTEVIDMAQCLFPRFVKRPLLNKSHSHLLPAISLGAYKNIRPYANDLIPVPCGKCINCLKNKQNAMISRVYAEAEKRGTFAFLTLTYDEDHLPLAEQTYRVSVDTGEVEKIGLEYKNQFGEFEVDTKPRIIHGHRFKDLDLSYSMRSIAPGELPRYIQRPIFDSPIDGYNYFSVVTPSLNREDVRLWLKSSRVAYEREFGKKLDFSYVCVGEYGPRTCRPHYHLALFGLSTSALEWLVARWAYGRTHLQIVPRLNKDGSDAYQLASRYIGKYMSKGKFECPSVLDGDSQKPRVMQSKGLGNNLVNKLRNYLCAFDLYGEYDLDTFYCPSKSRRLSEDEIHNIVCNISKRLCYDLNQKVKLPVPRIIREKIFYRPFSSEASAKTRFPHTVWSLVQADICQRYADIHQSELREFLARNQEREISEALAEYESILQSRSQLAESSGAARLLTFYQHSKF